MDDHRLQLLKRDSVLDEFANYIYDYGYRWLLEFLRDYEIASGLRCKVYGKFGEFKYEEMYIWAVEPNDEIVELFYEGDVPDKDEILELFRKEFKNETAWIIKGLPMKRVAYRVVEVPKEIGNMVKDLIVEEVIDYDLEFIECQDFPLEVRYTARINDESIKQIGKNKNARNFEKLLDEKYWGLYEYYIFF